MKRRIALVVIALLLVCIAVIYITIPARLVVSSVAVLPVNGSALTRALNDFPSWKKWWPGNSTKTSGASYSRAAMRFTPDGRFYDAVGISIAREKDNVRSRLTVIALASDSALLVWSYEEAAGSGPFARIAAYRRAVRTKKVMAGILSAMKGYLGENLHVYGVPIAHNMSADSTLISIRFSTSVYPTTAEIYRNLDSLHAYIVANQARIVNYPMMRVEKTAQGYKTMLAFPVNKALPTKGKYEFKRFLPWKMLTAEVKGGDSAVARGGRQFDFYVQDHGIPIMANAFQFLVTDRSTENDSARWITRISAPIP